ncbi:MAG: magnesium/cobalt transporter CorA [Crocinitomicaceae bacterium]
MKHKEIQIYTYNTDEISIKKGISSFDEIGDITKTADTSWLNFHRSLTDDELKTISELLGIHPTTKTDIVYTQKRAKVEEYENYIFFSVTSALPTVGKKLKTEQISFILADNYVVSFQEKSSDHFGEIRKRLENKEGIIRTKKSDYLLFKLLEAIIDNYFEVLDKVIDQVEIIDNETSYQPNQSTLHKIDEQKRKLIYLKRSVFPMKEVVNILAGGHERFLDSKNVHYFQNLKDDCLSIIDEMETNKQILEGLSQLYYATLSSRMNEIMKVLTIIGAIFIPLTFIVGVYGMNFEFMPELHYKYGYFISLGAMAMVTLGMILYFRKKKWL